MSYPVRLFIRNGIFPTLVLIIIAFIFGAQYNLILVWGSIIIIGSAAESLFARKHLKITSSISQQSVNNDFPPYIYTIRVNGDFNLLCKELKQVMLKMDDIHNADLDPNVGKFAFIYGKRLIYKPATLVNINVKQLESEMVEIVITAKPKPFVHIDYGNSLKFLNHVYELINEKLNNM